jgi:hypothetical protein
MRDRAQRVCACKLGLLAYVVLVSGACALDESHELVDAAIDELELPTSTTTAALVSYGVDTRNNQKIFPDAATPKEWAMKTGVANYTVYSHNGNALSFQSAGGYFELDGRSPNPNSGFRIVPTTYGWGDMEITAVVYVVDYGSASGSETQELSWTGRSIGHHDDSIRGGCDGTGYHANLHYNGNVDYKKEVGHTWGYTSARGATASGTGNLKGKWIGFKAIFLNNGSAVRNLIYVDALNNGTWTKVNEVVDSSSNPWSGKGPAAAQCASRSLSWIITSSQPYMMFRFDNVWARFKKLTVRAIQSGAPSA